jgi:hypothetical protein
MFYERFLIRVQSDVLDLEDTLYLRLSHASGEDTGC